MCFTASATRDVGRDGDGTGRTRGVVAEQELLELGARGGAGRPGRLLEPLAGPIVPPPILHRASAAGDGSVRPANTAGA